jgi:hypothetical protein
MGSMHDSWRTHAETAVAACRCGHFNDAHESDARRCAYCLCEAFDSSASQYTDELRSLADIALRMAERDLEQSGNVRLVIALRLPNGSIDNLPLPDRAGELMNYGEAKDILFGGLRDYAASVGATAVIIGTEAWVGRTTEKGRVLLQASPDEYKRMTRQAGFQDAVDAGLVERREAVVITVETPERCMILTHVFERTLERKIVWHERTQIEARQSEFAGRQKMFGDCSEENLG